MRYKELREKTEEYVKFYNEEYVHSPLGYRSPKEVYEGFIRKEKKEEIIVQI